MSKFIFMLTHNDRTVPNAFEVFEEVKAVGLQNIGFKDVGLPFEDLKRLAELINREGLNSFLEVVSEREESCMAAVKQAVKMGVKNVIGVKREYAERAYRILSGIRGVRFYPYVGRVIGIPEVLEGGIGEIVEDAKRFEAMGVDGINLLAYRYVGDPEELMREVINSVGIDVIVAGSINSFDRIEAVLRAGAGLYTIGTAIFERKFVPGGNLADQVRAVLEFEGKIS